jgi:hypothetical protein
MAAHLGWDYIFCPASLRQNLTMMGISTVIGALTGLQERSPKKGTRILRNRLFELVCAFNISFALYWLLTLSISMGQHFGSNFTVAEQMQTPFTTDARAVWVDGLQGNDTSIKEQIRLIETKGDCCGFLNASDFPAHDSCTKSADGCFLYISDYVKRDVEYSYAFFTILIVYCIVALILKNLSRINVYRKRVAHRARKHKTLMRLFKRRRLLPRRHGLEDQGGSDRSRSLSGSITSIASSISLFGEKNKNPRAEYTKKEIWAAWIVQRCYRRHKYQEAWAKQREAWKLLKVMRPELKRVYQEELKASLTLQKVARAWLEYRRKLRLYEYEAMQAMERIKNRLIYCIHFLVGMMITFALYMCLIYGVKVSTIFCFLQCIIIDFRILK